MTPFDQRMQVEVLRSAGRHLLYDPCLARAASEFGRHIRPGGDGEVRLPRELQEFVLHHAGCTEGWVASHLQLSGDADEDAFVAHLQEVLSSAGDMTHVGVGRAKAPAPYQWSYVVFLAERYVSFEPVSRTLVPGERLEIRGTVDERELSNPRVLVLEPEGSVQHVETLMLPGGGFRAEVDPGGKEGMHWVELLGDGPLGPRVAALFPVFVGADPPVKLRLDPPPDEQSVRTEEDAERHMLKLLNRERRRFGLHPLRSNPGLVKIARKHSAEMRDQNYFAHTSPYSGTLKDRFDRDRFYARSIAENISRSLSVHDAMAGLMQSLGHRENILRADFTDVGVGAAFYVDEHGKRNIFFTQNFAIPQRSLTGREFRDEVLGRIHRQREKTSLSPLESPRLLQELAARYVRQGVDEASSTRISREIRDALERKRFPYKSVLVQIHQVMDPNEVKVPGAVLVGRVSAVGFGAYPFKTAAGETRWKTLIVLVES